MKKLLVAYDGGEPAKHALEQAAELASALGASVSVVSVVPAHPGKAPVDPADDREVHLAELAEAKAFLATRGLEWHLLEPAGDPARTIEELAVEGGYDAVIVGSRGLGTLERFFQGSVSEHVATHAKTTVIVVR